MPNVINAMVPLANMFKLREPAALLLPGPRDTSRCTFDHYEAGAFAARHEEGRQAKYSA